MPRRLPGDTRPPPAPRPAPTHQPPPRVAGARPGNEVAVTHAPPTTLAQAKANVARQGGSRGGASTASGVASNVAKNSGRTPTEQKASTAKGVSQLRQIGRAINSPGSDPYRSGRNIRSASSTRSGGFASDAGSREIGVRSGGPAGVDSGTISGVRTLPAPRTGGLRESFGDSDIVGSQNTIDTFEGDSYSSAGGEGGGGGTGSSTFGQESAAFAGAQQGQSVDEVVYGVQKKRKRATAARKAGE